MPRTKYNDGRRMCGPSDAKPRLASKITEVGSEPAQTCHMWRSRLRRTILNGHGPAPRMIRIGRELGQAYFTISITGQGVPGWLREESKRAAKPLVLAPQAEWRTW